MNRKRNIYAAMLGCFLCGITAFAGAWAGYGYTAPLQFIGVIFFTALIYITVRYRLTEFYYSISEVKDDDTGEISAFFTVSRKVGSRLPIVEFKMNVADIVSVHKLSRRGTFAGCTIDRKGLKIYNFTVGMLCGGKYLVKFKNEDGSFGAVIEPDDDMLAALTAYAGKVQKFKDQ